MFLMAQHSPLLPTAAGTCLLLTLAGCGGDNPAQPGPSDGPVVHSVSPESGPLQGGTSLVIRGTRFAAGAQVTIGGRAASDVAVQSADSITAVSPAAPVAGAADVVVAVAGRSTSLRGGFTYVAAPQNALPVVESLTARGSRPRQPANFADLGEALQVTAVVTDEETDLEDLEYDWTATLGTFTGSGRQVTWRAPAAAPTPVNVTITLRVTERFGPGSGFTHEVTGTRTVSLHDSETEVGNMAERFLEEFSQPQSNQDWQDVMADFDVDGTTCPDPSLVDDERQDVIDHYEGFFMHEYTIGAANVTIRFEGSCTVPGRSSRPGDACVNVAVRWDSTEIATDTRAVVTGTDYLSAAYSSPQRRWWLCSSDFRSSSTFRHRFYDR